LTASQASCSAACERRIRAVQAAYRRCLRLIQVRPESLHQRMTLGTSSRFAGRSRPCCARRRICHALRGDRCWRGEIQDVREIVFKCHIPPDLVVQPCVFHNSLESSIGYPHGMSCAGADHLRPGGDPCEAKPNHHEKTVPSPSIFSMKRPTFSCLAIARRFSNVSSPSSCP
jgi:hypothetical protein